MLQMAIGSHLYSVESVGEPVFVWLADLGLIDVFERGSRAGQPVVDGIPCAHSVGNRFGHFWALRTNTDPLR